MNIVERKLLGGLLQVTNDNMVANISVSDLAYRCGYKAPGGIHTYALKMLEIDNHITKLDKDKFKVLI